MASASDSQTNPVLLEAVRDLRNKEAWTAFSDRYKRLIQACCLKQGLGTEEADEVTQAVLVKLVELMPKFEYDRNGRLRGWLRTLVSNTVVDHWRKAARRPGDQVSGDTAAHEALANLPDPHSLDSDAVADALHDQIERDLRVRDVCDRVRGRVGERTWQAFWLKMVDGLEGAKIAEQLGISPGAVYQAGYRVRSMIEEDLGSPS